MTNDRLSCRYDRDLDWRVLSGRHEDDCSREDCRGCLRCPDRHCVVCVRNHVDHEHPLTCSPCVGRTRVALADIERLTALLPDQAVEGADDGRLVAGAPIPGGEAMVLLAGYSDGRSQTRAILSGRDENSDLEFRGDPEPPLGLLASWEDDWRSEFGHGGGPLATITRAVDYLGRHLSHAAQHHLAFDEFARDVYRCRGRLEDVLREGERDETGAPCVHCQTTLVRRSSPPKRCGHNDTGPDHICDQGGLRDEWECPRCRRVYDYRSYWNAVGAAYRAHARTMTADDLSQQFDVPRSSVTAWASKGRVRRRGKDTRGRQLYDVEDVKRHAGITTAVVDTGSNP